MTTRTIDPSGLSDGSIPSWVNGTYAISSAKIISSLSGIHGWDSSSWGPDQTCTVTIDTVGTSGGGVWNPGPMILYKSLTDEMGFFLEFDSTTLHLVVKGLGYYEIGTTTVTVAAGDTLRLYSTWNVTTGIVVRTERNGVDIPALAYAAGDTNPIYTSCNRIGLCSRYSPANWKASLLVLGDNAVSNPVPTYSGTISNISATQSVAITPVDVHALFSDTDALAYTASPAGTSWPSGLSINSSTGVISGTMGTVATTTGLKVRATDTASQTVDSNAFNVTVSAPATRSISVTITSDGTTPRASETGLKAAWYDNTFVSGSPLLTSSSKTTNGSGVFAWTLTGSTLGAGGVGYLVVTNSDGTTSQSPPPWAIALPVTVS